MVWGTNALWRMLPTSWIIRTTWDVAECKTLECLEKPLVEVQRQVWSSTGLGFGLQLPSDPARSRNRLRILGSPII